MHAHAHVRTHTHTHTQTHTHNTHTNTHTTHIHTQTHTHKHTHKHNTHTHIYTQTHTHTNTHTHTYTHKHNNGTTNYSHSLYQECSIWVDWATCGNLDNTECFHACSMLEGYNPIYVSTGSYSINSKLHAPYKVSESNIVLEQYHTKTLHSSIHGWI